MLEVAKNIVTIQDISLNGYLTIKKAKNVIGLPKINMKSGMKIFCIFTILGVG
ncbi:hypothetical protein VCHA40P240_120026 [Vibrio chagasii]|nr:hypothetical protein VCHA40P240_120026 [Vibrio chagasii]